MSGFDGEYSGGSDIVLASAPPPVEVDYGPRFEDFGGLDREIDRLREVGALLLHPDIARKWDLHVPTGVLLGGPSGVGKTELMYAFAADIGAELIDVNVSDILGQWSGDANKSLKAFFTKAANVVGPAVLFFDEMDGLFGKNGVGNNGVSTTLLSEMKTIMPKVRRQQPNTIVAGATNDVTGFDEALLRPVALTSCSRSRNPMRRLV